MMNAINAVASVLNRSIDALIIYVKANGVAIGILLAGVYYYRSRYPNGRSSRGYVLSSSGQRQQGENGPGPLSTTTADTDTSNSDIDSRREELRRARERQQDIANQRAKEAARKRKEKEEKKRKNCSAKKDKPQDGNRLGDGRSTNQSRSTTTSSRTTGHNPMQPWSSNTSSYRAPRRSPNA
uniref:Uncharacterized protein n=1 Tax=Pseudo-nitzschia australis TaxID=44445 RepID=A0A7S4AEB1_9STRA|mmetsp:Transcript_24729/g.54251  ORF Transcript_24729/g.54251 Transcript_24729/m.54251 type:complete len:182 (+) Transcript_24729:160-705(+)